MFRYVAFVWNDADRPASEAAARFIELLQSGSLEWQAAVKQNGLAVFYAGARAGSSEAYFLQNDNGVVLGKLFVRSQDGRWAGAPLSLDARESTRISATGGRYLIDRYWGRYVAFLRDAAAHTTWVLRDPTAIIPCHTIGFSGVSVYFSWMEDAVRLGFDSFSIDWNYVGATLRHMRLQTHYTALEKVSQVLGGECVSVTRGQTSRTFYWDPLRIASTDSVEDSAEAARLLYHCVQECVHAWASCHSSIVHTLSGGLDSSIVMACLQKAPSRPRTTCVNYHAPGADADERHFARLMARHAGCELVELERDSALSFAPLLSMQRSSVPPVTFLYYLENNRMEAQVAAACGATAVFSGNVGDQLFYQASGAFAAGDFVSSHGITRPLLNVAMDAARMDRVSVWAVLRAALAQGRFGRQWHPASDAGQYRRLLATDVVNAVEREESFIHPLFRRPGRFPSGKLYHAYSLLFPPDFYPPMGHSDDPEFIAPLYSQPLIELSLRIPTYLLAQGGWDRAMARRAFQHDVPHEIVTRQTKGGMEEHAKAIFLKNIGLARELLLDGLLLQHGILDGKKLRDVLSGSPGRLGTGTVELYDCFAAEAWVRRWCSAQRRRAA